MAERKIVVPEGMLKAAVDSWISNGDAAYKEYAEMAKANTSDLKDALESALGWLSANPIVPTEQQWRDLYKSFGRGDPSSPYPIEDQLRFTVFEWQRRMFLAPEPQGIDDLLVSLRGCSIDQIDGRIREAYQRGQKAGNL
jgi:hypothetical protein